MSRRIAECRVDSAIMLYADGYPVKAILDLVRIDSKTLYKYLRKAEISLRKPWFCNHRPKNPTKLRRDTNEK